MANSFNQRRARLTKWLMFIGFLASSVQAETLDDAVRSAYETNPGLLEKRAIQRALDETYVQAQAGWRPTLSVQAIVSDNREDLGRGLGAELLTDATGNLVPVGGGGSYSYNSGNATLQASQPLYTGGRVRAAVDAAEADVLGGREDLRSAEIQLVAGVAQAYADVSQNSQVVAVRQANLQVLGQEVEQAQAKVDLGQATQVDLAQARAQQAAARAQLAAAQGQLQISAAAYQAFVGHTPGSLAPDPALPDMPPTVDAAFAAAETESPTLRQAIYAEQAARFRVTQARAAKRPTVTANFSVGYTGAMVPFATDRFERALAGSVTMTQPLYTGGVVSSQVRQALDRDAAARLAVDSTRRIVVQSVSQAWSALGAADISVSSNKEQVEAAQLAFKGLREQNQFGTATTLDLLIQQQQFRDAQLALIQTEHDLFVSHINVLVAVGRLSASYFGRGLVHYDRPSH